MTIFLGFMFFLCMIAVFDEVQGRFPKWWRMLAYSIMALTTAALMMLSYWNWKP